MQRRTWTGLIVIGALLLVSASILVVTNALTEKKVGAGALEAALPDLQTLFPEADEKGGFTALSLPENTEVDFACQVSKGDMVLGYGVGATMQGYGGPIQIVAGFLPEGPLQGIQAGGAGFMETEGLGSKVRDEAFTSQFAGKTAPLELGEDVETVTGATISSRAVVNGVNRAAEGLWKSVNPVPAKKTALQEVSASALGYGGPVLVQMALDENGAIQALAVGAARFLETEGIGSKVREQAFVAQFVGKVPPMALGEGIDAVSGATVSSQAVVDAVNTGYTFLHQ